MRGTSSAAGRVLLERPDLIGKCQQRTNDIDQAAHSNPARQGEGLVGVSVYLGEHLPRY